MWCGTIVRSDCAVSFTSRCLRRELGALVPVGIIGHLPERKHGSAMAMWGVGVMVGPILGPYLGGLLTEYYSWRWVFYINVPFGILAWFGLAGFLDESSWIKTQL